MMGCLVPGTTHAPPTNQETGCPLLLLGGGLAAANPHLIACFCGSALAPFLLFQIVWEADAKTGLNMQGNI